MGTAAPSPRSDRRERTIQEHLPLVQSIAGRYARRGEPLDELVQAGSIGLIKAVDRFDPARGAALASFAAPVIEGEIRHHLRDHRRHAAREAAGSEEAVDRRAGDDDESEARLLLAGGWHTLTERERRLLELRYFDDLTQAQIADRLGLSQAQVSRLLRATLDRLRTEIGEDVAAGAPAPYSGPEMATPAAEPEQSATHSGRLLVRMPPSLHTQLARAAEREGVSLNTLVTGALAGAVGWRDAMAEEPEPAEPVDDTPVPAPAVRRRTLLAVALAANFAIVALAAVLAIVLLVAAWHGG